MFARAAGSGITEAAVRAIVERLGGEAIGRDQLVPWLDNWIEAARRELGRRTNEGEAFEAARREAERRFRQGRLADASAAFMDALAEEEGEELERQEERKRRRLRLLEEAVRFDELAFDGEAAAEKLRRMAAIEGIDRPDALGRWLFDKAGEFYERGQGKGENGALLVAIDTYRAALLERTQRACAAGLGGDPEQPRQRAAGAGRARGRDGAAGGGGRGLPRGAAGVHAGAGAAGLGGDPEQPRRRAAERWASARPARRGWRRRSRPTARRCWSAHSELVPLDWAGTQNNLGNALRALGGREAGTGRLEEAVAAFRAALLEYTQERVPLDWATTQNNLGAALRGAGRARGRHGAAGGGGRGLPRGAAGVHARAGAAGLGDDPEQPRQRAAGAGRARGRHGAAGGGGRGLPRGAAGAHAERVPLDWAATQNNLGAALQRLGEREAGTERLEEAVAAYRAALLEYTQERVPLDWATIQNNLGAALRALGEREADTGRLEEAVAAYRAALLERTRERVPLDWAATQNNLGNVLTGLGKRQADAALVRGAIYGLEQVVEVFEDASHAPYAAMARANLNMAREILGRLGDEVEGAAGATAERRAFATQSWACPLRPGPRTAFHRFTDASIPALSARLLLFHDPTQAPVSARLPPGAQCGGVPKGGEGCPRA